MLGPACGAPMRHAAVSGPNRTATTDNFPVVSWLIPAPLRPTVAVFYRLARASDDIADAAELDAKAHAMCERLKGHAPLTMAAAKEAMRRITLHHLPVGEDLIRSCYGSADFKEGMAAFLAKRPPKWQGR